jgi:hypothetical protein
MRVLRLVAAGLQMLAACLWVLPQTALAAPVLILPQVPGEAWLWPLISQPLTRPETGDARLYLAQTSGCGNDCPTKPQGGGSSSGSDGGPQGISPAATDRFAKMFLDTTAFCRQLDIRYRIDCLYARFRMIAQSLPLTGDYAALRAALIKAANRLEDVVDSYEDPAGPKVSPRLKSQPAAQRMRPLSPIRPEKQAVANRVATEVVTELSAVLLRSSSGSERRQLAFQEIAAAVDSTKVLLRST